MTNSKSHRPLAARLLDDILTKTDWRADFLAYALGFELSELEAYRRGEQRMSVAQQLALADFVLSRMPACSRTARRLKSQATAEASFLAKETATHMVAPPSLFWR